MHKAWVMDIRCQGKSRTDADVLDMCIKILKLYDRNCSFSGLKSNVGKKLFGKFGSMRG